MSLNKWIIQTSPKDPLDIPYAQEYSPTCGENQNTAYSIASTRGTKRQLESAESLKRVVHVKNPRNDLHAQYFIDI